MSGLVTLAAAVLGVTCEIWLARSAFVPISGSGIEYLFVSATLQSFTLIAFAVTVLVLGVHLLVRRDAAAHGGNPPWLSRPDTLYLAPLCWCGISLLPLLNLIPTVGRVSTVASYAIVDLRWWWTAAVAVCVVRRIDIRTHGAWRGRCGASWARLSADRRFEAGALAVLACVWSVMGTPLLRSRGGSTGDEPKYLRYCELWYQGLGFDVAQIKPMSALPSDFRPRLLRNFALLAEAAPSELRGLVADAGRFAADPFRQFNAAKHVGGGFVAGKNGGTYQMHNPGVSLVIFPAYLVDRALAPIVPGSSAQWPEHLPVVNALMIAIYASWCVAILAFLRKCGASPSVAWWTTVACTFTLPAAAFPFQYYPELIAGLFVTIVAGYILFDAASSHSSALAYGLLVGYLPWLHVRFSAVTIAFAGASLVLWRGDINWRRRARFLFGIAAPLVLYSLYVYRISGSVMPSALWTASGDENNFGWLSMIRNSAAYLVDRDWGLLAHSPVLLLALPGYWLMARRMPAVAAVAAVVFLSLLLPAAGKTLIQTTPMRLIVAVVPLGATPLIETLSRRSRLVWILFAFLLVLSLDNALAYNFHHDRMIDILIDPSFSGWKVNMLFPFDSRQPWQASMANGMLLLFWLATIVALVVAPVWMRPAPASSRESAVSAGTAAVAGTAIFVVLATSVSAVTGAWTWRKYLMTPPEAARTAALELDDLGRCAICYSSTEGPIGRKDSRVGAQRLLLRLESIDPSVVDRHTLQWHDPAYAEWLEMPGRIRAWYVEANGHEPGGGELGHYLYQWREEHVSAPEIRRRIFLGAGKAAPERRP